MGERINAPDISILKELAQTLDVDVVELLSGESNKSIEKENINDTMVNTVKFYENRIKQKAVKKLIFISILFLVIITFILFLYWVNNYNKIKVYNINTTDILELDGTIIFNPKQKCLIINRIYYNDIYTGTDLELKVKGLNIKIVNDEEEVYIKTGNLSSANVNEIKTINEYLYDISILDMEKIETDSGYIKEKDLNSLKLVLEYIDENDEYYSLEYSLNTIKEFSNTDLIY